MLWIYVGLGFLGWLVLAILAGLALGAVIRQRDRQVPNDDPPDHPSRPALTKVLLGAVIRRRDRQVWAEELPERLSGSAAPTEDESAD